MLKHIILLLILTIAMWSEVWSTPPKIPTIEPFLDAHNPTHYHQIVSSSVIPDLFQGCLLVDSGVPKHRASSPEMIYLNQIYLKPSPHSDFGLSYNLIVAITINCDTIMGISELSEIWRNYTERITKFENIPYIKRFLQVERPEKLNCDGSHIHTKGDGFNKMHFNLNSESFSLLLLKQRELIQDISLFLPKLDSLAWFSEFQSKIDIGRVHIDYDKLRISQSQNSPTVPNNILLHISKSRLLEINLSSNYTWENFPMVRYALQTVENRLVGDTLGLCEIKSGLGHVYFKLKRSSHTNEWHTRVAIHCQESPKRRAVCFRIKPDSTVDRFRVCYQSGN